MSHRILVFVDYFLPGYRAGGPIRTIANMIAHLGSTFAFRVITRDRDLGDVTPYSSVQVDRWNRQGDAEVFYASRESAQPYRLARLLRQTPHDLVYLNSFFSWRSAGLLLLLRRLGVVAYKPVVLAPRGEFSVGALALKSCKKRLYIWLTACFGLYRDICWQASSDHEATDIRRVMGRVAQKVMVAPNLLPPLASSGRREERHSIHSVPPPSEFLRLVFLSRISPKKNLTFLLQMLRHVNAPVTLAIYGPQEDTVYWEQCQALIADLPAHVVARHAGILAPEQVASALAQNDLFVFPTMGENFGHVIFESLNAGVPVLLSDQTPWLQTADGAVTTLPLTDVAAWCEAIEAYAGLSEQQRLMRRQAASRVAMSMMNSEDRLEANRQLFLEAVNG